MTSFENHKTARTAAELPARSSALETEWLATLDYLEAWELQREMVAARLADPALTDRVLLLEHPPTYTLGRSGKWEHLLYSQTELEQQGIQVVEVDRGGDITYHGPGQLVGYPILNIKRLHQRLGMERPDLHKYLRDLEQALIDLLAAFDIEGFRYPGYTGVWVEAKGERKKIAAIGVRVNHRGITSHGFALNVNPNLAHFSGIIPCGIREHGVTSMAECLGREIGISDVLGSVRNMLERVLVSPVPIATPG